MNRDYFAPLALAAALSSFACGAPQPEPFEVRLVDDPHSFARPGEVAVRHMNLDMLLDFKQRKILGHVGLELDRRGDARALHLDTRDLEIQKVQLDPGAHAAEFRLGDETEFLGRPLIIDLRPDTEIVHVIYETSPSALALQWLDPEQTAGGRHPFLLTQSQPTYARTWIPCQDTPGVRSTYEATVRVPPGLAAVMSAENPTEANASGVYRFRMERPIPSYLLALAVGDFVFRPLGRNTGVYAEPEVIERAAWEFADTQKMMDAAERLYGPYRWDRFDMIVLPPSFPFGGMENPMLTFVTPTLLAGDRSLVATVAHELAHSWSGNLVTNATWSDFWLNEGFTSYFEKRIMEELFGRDYAEMLWSLDTDALVARMAEMDPADTGLVVEVEGRDPEDAGTIVAYEKGALFLRLLEERFGRERWDAFLEAYFDAFAFRSMDTESFLAYLRRELVDDEDEQELKLDAWVHGPGLPDNRPRVEATSLDTVDEQLSAWIDGLPADSLDTDGWTTHHRLHFVRNLPDSVPAERLAELDAALGLTATGNAEVLHAWLMQSLAHDYEPAMPALERFLTGMGRLKFLSPLYERLVETPEGRGVARRIYAKARPGYHAISRAALDPMMESGAD